MRASDLLARRRGFAAMALALAIAVFPPAALAQSDLEARLRQALQQARAQITALEQQNTLLQAQLVELEEEKEAEVRAVQEEATEQIANVEARFEAARAQFQERIGEEGEFRNKLLDNIEKWKEAYAEVAEVAREKEQERLALTEQLATAEQQNEICIAKNQELFTVGNEILDRLANIRVGEAIALREPFIGLRRVQLQNIVQDYEDELLDNKVRRPQ